MSKHSKNNTNSQVFTYMERQKLKNQYGSHNTRIGQDSIKTFKMCTICNSLLDEPMSCPQGHVFCKSCVVEFLVKQKQKMAQNQAQIDLFEKKKDQVKKDEQFEKDVKKLEQFEKYDTFLQITGREKLVTQNPSAKKDEIKPLTIKDVKPVGIYELNPKKDQYVKTAFWTLQNTPKHLELAGKEAKEVKVVKCPGGDHKLTLKKLRPLVIKQIEKEYYCWICSKEVHRQRVGVYKCGHVVCQHCKSNRCQVCEQKDGWMALESGASAFASHQKAQVKTYTHAFIG